MFTYATTFWKAIISAVGTGTRVTQDGLNTRVTMDGLNTRVLQGGA